MPTIPHRGAVPSPADYRRVRRFALNTAGQFVQVDLRGADWAPHASTGAPAVQAAANARLMRLEVRILGVEAGNWVQVGMQADPGDAVLTSDHQAYLDMPLGAQEDRSAWYWKTSGALTVEVVAWFDIIRPGFES